jgi:hypothetical protein
LDDSSCQSSADQKGRGIEGRLFKFNHRSSLLPNADSRKGDCSWLRDRTATGLEVEFRR